MAKISPMVRVGSGAFWSFFAQFVSAVGSLVAGILVARVLGPEAKGILSIIQQYVAILVVALGFGISTANVYFIASRKVSVGSAVANSLVLLGTSTVLASGAIVAFFYLGDLPRQPWLIALAVGSYIANNAIIFFSGILMGAEGNRRPALSNLIAAAVSLVVFIDVYLTNTLTVSSVISATVIGNFFGFVFLVLPLGSKARTLKPDWSAFTQMFSYSAKGFAGELAAYVHLRLDILVVGFVLGKASAGIFSVGVSFAELIWFIPGALGAAVIASASRLEYGSKRDVSGFASRIATVLVIVTGIVLSVLVPEVLPLLFGAKFAPSVWIFFALLPGAMADGMLRVVNNYALSMGVVYWVEQFVGLAINACAVIFAAHYFGIQAVALASTISYTLVLVLISRKLRQANLITYREYFVIRKSDIEWTLRSLRSYVRR